MKLCVIGNSHAGMLAQAWRDAPPEGLELTFFAKQGRGPEGARLRGTELRAVRRELRRSLARMGMPEAVNLPDFDGFVIVAMSATVFSLMGMASSHAVYSWPSAQAAEGPGRPLMSLAALEAAVCADIGEGLAAATVGRIRRITAAPVLIVPQPHPSERLLEQTAKFAALRELHRRGDGAEAAAALVRAQARVFGAMPGVQILPQPEQTVAHGFLTRAEYTRGAGRLNEGGRQPESDILHANARYGGLVMRQIAEAAARF